MVLETLEYVFFFFFLLHTRTFMFKNKHKDFIGQGVFIYFCVLQIMDLAQCLREMVKLLKSFQF